jgi:hypothetical protein
MAHDERFLCPVIRWCFHNEVTNAIHQMPRFSELRPERPEKRVLTFERLTNRVEGNSSFLLVFRARIPGGWLVATRPNDNVTFVPDPNHEWNGGSLE